MAENIRQLIEHVREAAKARISLSSTLHVLSEMESTLLSTVSRKLTESDSTKDPPASNDNNESVTSMTEGTEVTKIQESHTAPQASSDSDDLGAALENHSVINVGVPGV